MLAGPNHRLAARNALHDFTLPADATAGHRGLTSSRTVLMPRPRKNRENTTLILA
ncbi:hypothetical protein RSPO_c01968 [Ralstonia solanacearum Po82]|uniref:Uncharacterized protein n=1 Tax=Ralstonia solanacearum (strain Po82) TaxID=1031711 RepID=F6G1Y3_RALS8|nr:hypothetical protein RSPO_c01968 [Ralstonia solanacearum Po82]